MRWFRYGIATVLTASLVPLAYSQGRTFAQPVNAHGALAAAAQKPEAPKAQEPKQPTEAPGPKPPKVEKQDSHSKQHEKADKQDQKMGKKQTKEQGAGKEGEPKGPHGAIAEKDYKAHFSQEHKFSARKVITTRTIIPNQTRFVYVGYTFVFLQPWPVGWGWDDDVYIDYMDGGYYLLDPLHPGVQVGLSIVM